MREVAFEKTNVCLENCTITADDRDPKSGASHEYTIIVNRGDLADPIVAKIEFQNGPLKENGVNGMTNEALLAIVVDRLEGFQEGQFASRESALALTAVQNALHWLHHRTRQRIARGVEGTWTK